MGTETSFCPHCHCTHKAHLESTGGEYVGLIIPGHGGIRPSVCLKCGTVYIPQAVLERIIKQEEKRWKVI